MSARAFVCAAICLLGAQATRAEPWDLAGARPEVRGDGLWVDGRPIYLVGVWVGGTVSTAPSLHKPDLDGDNIAYSELLSAATAPLLGINSAHPPMSALRCSSPWHCATAPSAASLRTVIKAALSSSYVCGSLASRRAVASTQVCGREVGRRPTSAQGVYKHLRLLIEDGLVEKQARSEYVIRLDWVRSLRRLCDDIEHNRQALRMGEAGST